MALGMYARICLPGDDKWSVQRMTVTMESITVTTYETLPLFDFNERSIDRAWMSYATHMGYDNRPIDKERLKTDLHDLMDAVSQVDKSTMVLPCGTKIVTYCVGQPVEDDETHFLEMSWEREAWWMDNPHIAPIVESIHTYHPDFKPWEGKNDMLMSLLLDNRSSLLRR